jgi:hypothetical protein
MTRAQLGFAGLAVGVLLTSGCSQASEPVPTAAAVAVDPATPVADLNAYHPKDAMFYDPMREKTAGALLVAPSETVKAAADKATVVVSAKVGDVAAQRVIGDVQTMRVVLTDVDVLHGKLEPSLGGKVPVELFLGEPVRVDSQIKALRSALPQGHSIWFLRWQGDKAPITKPDANPAEDPADAGLYAVIHRHAVFAQGPKGVITAIAERDPEGRAMPGLQADGEKYTKLSDLAAPIRAF